MPDTKISALAAAGALDGAETLPIVQGGVTKRVDARTFVRQAAGVYSGLCATGCGFATSAQGYCSVTTQSRHIARAPINGLQVAYANAYIASNTENGTGASVTWSAWVKYPIAGGSWTQLTWSGATSVTTASKTLSALSDAAALVIPEGEQFLLWTHAESAGTVTPWAAEALTGGATVSSYLGTLTKASTTPNGVTNAPGDISGFAAYDSRMLPTLIVSAHARPAVLLLGDSRVQGQSDYSDAAGYRGCLEPSLAPFFAVLNGGNSGESLYAFLNTSGQSAIRRACAAYFSHIAVSYGINDLGGVNTGVGVRSAAQVLADDASLIALFPGKKVLLDTVMPSAAASAAISAFAVSGTTGTVTVPLANGLMLRMGQSVKIAGATPAGYNGTYQVLGVTPNATGGTADVTIAVTSGLGAATVTGTLSDAWASAVFQAPFSYEAGRVTVNRTRRACGVAGQAGYFDTARVSESALDAGRWGWGPGGGALTDDGLHPNPIGYARIRSQKGGVDPHKIAR